MTAGILLMIVGIVIIAGAYLFYWSLYCAAAMGDRLPHTPDCFTTYRLHLLSCSNCDPPEKRCPVGEAIRLAAVEDFVERRLVPVETD